MKAPRIGILGNGQLGALLVEAGDSLGIQCAALSGIPSGSELSAYDIITYENESFDIDFIKALAKDANGFFPPPAALEVVRNRLEQKRYLTTLGIDVAPFVEPALFPCIADAFSSLGRSSILKLCTGGYDGKGQFRLESARQAPDIPEIFSNRQTVLEALVPFDRELSLISVRSRVGEVSHYPLAENIHRDGILIATMAPIQVDASLKARAENIAERVLADLHYVGVLAIEFFEVHGELIVNEVATRVHNSGHWTLDGAETSQFVNHLRAGLGMPLGSTQSLRPTLMINLLGKLPGKFFAREFPSARVYGYGKTPAPKRKMGHLNMEVAGDTFPHELLSDILIRLDRNDA